MKGDFKFNKLLDLLKLLIKRDNEFKKYCLDEKKNATGEEKIRYGQKTEDAFMVVSKLEQVIKKAFWDG